MCGMANNGMASEIVPRNCVTTFFIARLPSNSSPPFGRETAGEHVFKHLLFNVVRLVGRGGEVFFLIIPNRSLGFMADWHYGLNRLKNDKDN